MALKHFDTAKTTAKKQYTDAELPYFYESHPTRKDLMPEAVFHSKAVQYLVNVLEWLYHSDDWLIADNFGIYQTPDYMEDPAAPDVAVFKDIITLAEVKQLGLRSWKMLLADRPPPPVVFEFASKETWREDLRDKPAIYQRMGAKEYFAYDANLPSVWREKRKRVNIRLRAWSYEGGSITELTPNENGWLWSAVLDSWLVPDNEFLRLYAANGQLRLNRAEQAELEAQQARSEVRRALTEVQQAKDELEKARQREEALRAKLRALGLDEA